MTDTTTRPILFGYSLEGGYDIGLDEHYRRFNVKPDRDDFAPEFTEATTSLDVARKLTMFTPKFVEHRIEAGAPVVVYHFYDGSGFYITVVRNDTVWYHRFLLCDHSWDAGKAVHTRTGWHHDECSKCHFINEWDSSG